MGGPPISTRRSTKWSPRLWRSRTFSATTVLLGVACEPRSVEGDKCDRALSYGGARRPCRALRERGVRPCRDRRQLLPQPALPEVPSCGVTPVARRPRSRAVAGALLSCRVHAAERAA